MAEDQLAINIALAFCMGSDLDGILNSDIGQPMVGCLQSINDGAIDICFVGSNILPKLRSKRDPRHLGNRNPRPIHDGL